MFWSESNEPSLFPRTRSELEQLPGTEPGVGLPRGYFFRRFGLMRGIDTRYLLEKLKNAWSCRTLKLPYFG